MKTKWSIPKECCGCTACASICPQHCIKMEKDEEGFLYPIIDKSRCVECGLCQKVCMIGKEEYQGEIINAYAAINYDSETRLRSSSGGVFSVLAKNILSPNGIVIGAVLSEDCKSVKHSIAHNNDELHMMCGSKYLQSDLQGMYVQAKKLLTEGKKVLFTGTPCQVNGLKLFLGREYDNLLTVDVICHGVPSPALWEKYVINIEKKYRAVVKMVNFRSKQYGWREFGINRIDVKNRELFISKDQDPFMQMFLRNYCLRSSCYQCSAKEVRYSDITIGDFWGIENIFPDMNDGKGTSAIIVRTKKGNAFLNKVSKDLMLRKVDYSDVVKNNSAELISVTKPIQRDTFFKDMNTSSFFTLRKKYLKQSLKLRLRSTLIRLGVWEYLRPKSRGVVDNNKSHLVFRLSNAIKKKDIEVS